MKKLFCIALASIAFSWVSAVQAETKIGILDIRAALFSSNSAKEFSKTLVDEFKPQEMEVRGIQDQGRKLQERLKKDAALMSDTERAKLASELEAKVQEFKYLRQKLDAAINQKKQEFIQKSKPRIDEVLKGIVEGEKLDMILPRETVIYVDPKMDITAKVIEQLNK